MRAHPDLTPRQSAVLRFIHARIRQEGRAPTLREIGQHFGFSSTGSTRDHIKVLAKKGYIRLHPRQARSIEISKNLFYRIPLLGRIAAGTPNIALEETDEYISLDDLITSSDQETFGLRIKGDSMIDLGLCDNDVAIVRRQRSASPGDIVAALLENEATIKTLRKKESGYFLSPANRRYPDIHRPFSILGRVIAVIKKF